jgi:uncharacterized protein (TIGR03118 family)
MKCLTHRLATRACTPSTHLITACVTLALTAGLASAQVYPVVNERDAAPNFDPVPARADYDKTNAYVMVNMVATDAKFKPHFMVDPLITNAWGLTIRPPGKGGHWWITNAGSGNTTTYIGDAPGHRFGQDELKVVDIPVGALHAVHPELKSQPTGQVYAGFNKVDWPTRGVNVDPTKPDIIGAARFIFVTLDGTVTAWDNGMKDAQIVIDMGAQDAMFTGVAISTFPEPGRNRLYCADFNAQRVLVFGTDWKPVTVAGDWKDPRVDEGYVIYNLQVIDNKVYAAWANPGGEPAEPQNYPGYGFISEFDLEGRLLRSFEHRKELIAPWGFAKAPANFGALSNRLLVGNFGDGRILAYDLATARFDDYLRNLEGQPIEVDGLWGLTFGNGETLGYSNHLYYAAGPEAENQGIFGKLVPIFP